MKETKYSLPINKFQKTFIVYQMCFNNFYRLPINILTGREVEELNNIILKKN